MQDCGPLKQRSMGLGALGCVLLGVVVLLNEARQVQHHAVVLWVAVMVTVVSVFLLVFMVLECMAP